MENKVLKIEWLLTRKCNLRCSYCKIRKGCTLNGPELEMYQVFDGIRVLNRMFPGAAIVFFGGEPTMLDWLPNIVAHCEQEKVKYAVISNGLRPMSDEIYFNRLIEAGISNWSVSIDSLSALEEVQADSPDNEIKTHSGFASLKKFRAAGVRDLVACITVTKRNIFEVPEIIKRLTAEGVWSITTPLQNGSLEAEYSSPSPELQCTDTGVIRTVAHVLETMARSGRYLMHNSPEYYTYWKRFFISQDWKCSSKNAITIDADGTLKRCVDYKGGLEKFNILTLEKDYERYQQAVAQEFSCQGCFWDPAFETSLRAKTWGYEEAKASFRHEMSLEQVASLSPDAKKWFVKAQ